jgi:hypothetical protein
MEGSATTITADDGKQDTALEDSCVMYELLTLQLGPF